MNGLRKRIDRKGSLPFAAVAVTVLVIASAWSVASMAIDDSRDNSEGIVRQSAAMDSAADATVRWIEQGLGEIIRTVSADTGRNTLEGKAEFFRDLSDRWMGTMFPATVSGVDVTADGWEFELTSTLLQSGSLLSAEGYTPAYLKASGTVELTIVGESGRSSRTVDIEADASSAVPFAVERGSLFANAIKGNGSILSQLMTYQLSSLAQFRVINGWGAISYYGDGGTASIITPEDVLESYTSSLSAVSSIYLCTAEGDWVSYADAASVFMSERCSAMDLNSVYAQALFGVADDIALKWLDYLGGSSLISDLDGVADALANAWDGIVSFLTGENTDSAERYIRDVCGDIGYGICSGLSYHLVLGDGTECDVPFPEKDIMATDAVNSFYSTYRNEVNGLQDWITGIVNGAVFSIAEEKRLGTAEFRIEKDTDFSGQLLEAALNASDGCITALEDGLTESLLHRDYPDRLSAAIWHYVDDNKDEELLYSFDSFLADNIGRVSQSAGRTVTEDELRENQGFLDAHAVWANGIDDALAGMSPLLNVAADNSGILRQGGLEIVKKGLNLTDMMIDVRPSVEEMCREFADSVSACGRSGVYEYPASPGFVLKSPEGTDTFGIDLEKISSPTATVTIDEDSCVHGTAVHDGSVASYTTVWKVSLRDDLGIVIRTYDDVSSLSGSYTSEYADTIDPNMELTVGAVSGWALYGVAYHPSNTLRGDAVSAVIGTLFDLMGPLSELMKTLQEIMSMLQDVTSRLCGVSHSAMELIYSKIQLPVGLLNDMIAERLSSLGCEKLMEILEGIERTYNITLSSQSVVFSYGGWSLKLTFYAGTMTNNTKHIVKTTLSGEVGGADFSTTVDIKMKGSGPYTPQVTGSFSASGDDWNVEGTVDPMMVSNNFMLEMSGAIRGTGFLIDLPVLDQYREVDLSLCDMAGLGTILSDIPFIIPGTSVSLDAGLDVKYNAPLVGGVIINEVEANPAGNDRDHEWAEILNLSSSKVDLTGWSLETSRFRTYHFPDDTVLNIGGRLLVEFEGQFLNNVSETLALLDSDGRTVQKVKLLNDSLDDDRTCQRAMDGYTEWGLYKGTPDAKNSGGLFGSDGTVTKACIEILKESARKAIGELGGRVTTEEGLAELIRLTLLYALDNGIDRLSNMLTEASLYIKVEFSDISSSVTLLGFRVHLTAYKDMAGDVLRYLVGKTAELVFGIEDPYNIDIEKSGMEKIYVGVTTYTGYGLPAALDPSGDSDVRIGADVSVNLAGIRGAFGDGYGTTTVRAGIAAFNIPYESIPKFMDADKHRSSDLWLFKLTLTPGSA